MSEYCNPMKCPAYASGWCEYDAMDDQFYPMEPHICPLLQKEGEPSHGMSTDGTLANG